MLARQKILKSPGQIQPFMSTANPIQNLITLMIGFLTTPWHGYWPHGLNAGYRDGDRKDDASKKNN